MFLDMLRIFIYNIYFVGLSWDAPHIVAVANGRQVPCDIGKRYDVIDIRYKGMM